MKEEKKKNVQDLEAGRRADAQRCYQRVAELDAEDEEWPRMAAALSQAR